MKFLWDKPSSFCQNHVEKSWTQFAYTLHIFHLGERVHPWRCEFSLVTRVMATCLHVFNTRLWQDPQPYFFIHVTEIQCFFNTAPRMCLFVVNSWEHSEELIWSTQKENSFLKPLYNLYCRASSCSDDIISCVYWYNLHHS